MPSSPKPVVVPLRLIHAGKVLQTTSKHLATGGVYVRCAEPPAPGIEVRIDLYLPDYSYPEMTRGVVRHVSDEPGEEGFWSEFIGLRDSLRKRIAALVHRSLEERPEGGDARAHPRYESKLAVRFSTAREFVIRYAYDLSAGGLFVRGATVPVHASVRLVLELPDGGSPVEADAVVVRSVAEAEGAIAGVGLQFVGANEEFRARIDAFIERLAAEPAWDEPETDAAALLADAGPA